MISALKKIFALVTTKTIPLEGDIGVQLVGKVVAVLGSPQKATAFAQDLSSADVLSIDGKGPKYAERRDKIGYVKFKGRKTFSDNNAGILILGKPRNSALPKDAFQRSSGCSALRLAGFTVTGPTPPYRPKSAFRIAPLGGQGFQPEIKCDVLDNHRQFYPLDNTARDFPLEAAKITCFFARKNEIDDLPAGVDIDPLIESGTLAIIMKATSNVHMYLFMRIAFFNRAPYVTL